LPQRHYVIGKTRVRVNVLFDMLAPCGTSYYLSRSRDVCDGTARIRKGERHRE
jgi:hypothetical protein